MSEAIALSSEAVEYLRQQRQPDMAAAVDTLRTAAMAATEEMLTPSQVARLINRHRNTVRNWANGGLIRAVKTGPRGDLRVPRSEAERLRGLTEGLDGMGWFTPREMEEYLAERRLAWREARERGERRAR